jgi:hypothetical protein
MSADSELILAIQANFRRYFRPLKRETRNGQRETPFSKQPPYAPRANPVRYEKAKIDEVCFGLQLET